MTILIAGATGLVGSALLREFKRLGSSVVGISSKDVNLLNRSATFEYIKNLSPRMIIDAAAKVGGIGATSSFPVEFLSQNVQIQTNLIDAAHHASVEKFVFLGSSCIYPRDCIQPIKEEYILTGALESTNSSYSIAKLAGIELIKSYRREYGHTWISVMPTNLYGPNDSFDLKNGHVLGTLIRKIFESKNLNLQTVNLWGTGEARREFLHVDDLAKAVVFCSENYDSDSIINIGTGTDTTIKELAKKIAEIIGFKGKFNWDTSKPNGTMQKLLDIEKITKLGWKPTIQLEQGLKMTVEWYQENHQRLNSDI
jgi:GDP-L-fucose synthase